MSVSIDVVIGCRNLAARTRDQLSPRFIGSDDSSSPAPTFRLEGRGLRGSSADFSSLEERETRRVVSSVRPSALDPDLLSALGRDEPSELLRDEDEPADLDLEEDSDEGALLLRRFPELSGVRPPLDDERPSPFGLFELLLDERFGAIRVVSQ